MHVALNSAPGTKVRFGPDGIHLFSRDSGANLLIEEIVPPQSMWSTAPRQVSIALTNTCDLSCQYCYAPKTHASLAFERVVSWLNELDANGTIEVGFGGGEPTLYPRFADICAYASKHTGLAVTFTTHGHHLNDKLLAQLKGNVHFLRVSMDGIGPIYESLRGRPFDKLAQRLSALREVVPFGINYVVNSCTLPQIGMAAEFAESVGASEFLLLPEQAVSGRVGIDEETEANLREWAKSYTGGVRLAISEKGAEGMPIATPFEFEVGDLAYVHIGATGVLKFDSYAREGVSIDQEGLLAALDKLRNYQTRTI